MLGEAWIGPAIIAAAISALITVSGWTLSGRRTIAAEGVQPVVRYYNQVFAIDAMIADLRSNGFAGATQDQRIKLYTDYVSLKIEARQQGLRAVEALGISLGQVEMGQVEMGQVKPAGPGINSRGAAPSGRSMGGET